MLQRLSIRSRIGLSATALILIVVAVISGAAYREVRQSALIAGRERLAAAVGQLSDFLGNSAIQALWQSRRAADDPRFDAFLSHPDASDRRSALAALAVIAGSSTANLDAELWDANGRRVLTTSDTMASLAPNVISETLSHLTRGPATMSKLVLAPHRADYILIARIAAGSEPRGFLVQRRSLRSSRSIAQLRDLAGPATTFLIGNSGDTLLTSFSGLERKPSTFALGSFQYQHGGSRRLAAAALIPNTPWALMVETPTSVVLESTRTLLWNLAGFTAVLLVLATFGAWAIGGALTRPIDALATRAEGFRSARPDRATDGPADQIGLIRGAFDVMQAEVSDSRNTLELKIAELENSEARYRALFESSPQSMWVYDLETWKFLAVNDAAIKRYGYSRDEFLSMTILEIRPKEDLERLAANLEALGRHGGVDADIWRHRTKDGRVMEVEVNSHALDFAGRPARIVVANDLTRRRLAEERLRATQARLERVLGSSGAILYELQLGSGGPDLDWISGNVTTILGYDVGEVREPGWWSGNVHPDDRAKLGDRPHPSAYRDGATVYRFRHGNGRYRWLREEQRLIPGPSGEAAKVIGVWVDITEHRELEDQLRQSQKMDAVGQLAGGIAHDFNNLLTVILAESEFLLVDDAASTPQQRTEALQQIHRSGERAALLTRQLLSFSRRQMVDTGPVDLNAVVTDIDKMIRRLIGEDVDLRLSLHEAPVSCVADVGQLEQVVVNLAVNARDAMPEGGSLTIETGIAEIDETYANRCRDIEPGLYATLAVTDSGLGMSDDVKAHIFEPFFTTKERGKGTGLGLATCYGIAKQSRGHLAVYSELGIGTRVCLYLPLNPGYAAAVADTSDGFVGGTETILLVEDEQPVRRIASRILEAHGYRVVEAADGEAALRQMKLRDGNIDLLLTDVVMPGIGGREVAERVREMNPDVAILFASGYSDDVILRHKLIGHDIALVQKPFTTKALLHKVRETLDAHSSSLMVGD